MENAHLNLRSKVASLYESHPYPPVGYLSAFLQRIRWEERPSLHYRAAYAAAYGSTEGAALIPRILVAGCGTLEPIVVALANPRAEILAVDLSAESLRRLDWQARSRGLRHRIRAWAGDFCELPESLGNFDFVIATGVLHHLPDPEAGLRALAARTRENSVFRFMVYSHWGRALLYATKELAVSLGVTTPAQLRALIASLPANHPYKIYFYLYGDTRTDAGLADGYLHPCDHAFRAPELRALLASAGLEVSAFLHGPEGQPEGGSWNDLALRELNGELQENFRFFAARAGRSRYRARGFEWNEALPAKGRLFSHILGKELAFDTRTSAAILPAPRVEELRRAFYLLPKGSP